MRIGTNPQKDQHQAVMDHFHQVVIPVYIPDAGDYFKESKAILEYCLDSLLLTVHKNTFITLVDNGSCNEVSDYLRSFYEAGKVHELIQTTNIGKINALFKGMMGHRFPLVTFADADVLFCKGWQEATYKIFETFPKTGFVSPTPNPKLWKYNTANILRAYRKSPQLQFQSVVASEALERFAESIENPRFYNSAHKEKQLVVTQNDIQAVVGAGHFVATYRRDAFQGYETPVSRFALGGKEVRHFLDTPVYQNGYWRLATANNYTYHMGNTLEPWMHEELTLLKSSNPVASVPKNPLQKVSVRKPGNRLRVFEKLLHRAGFSRRFLKRKGLTATEAEMY